MATVQSIASQVTVARATWTQTISRGELQRPLDAAYDALEGEQAEDHGQGPSGPPVASWAAQEQPDGDRGEAEDRGDHRVALDDPFERAGALEVEAVDELARVGAGVRARRRWRSCRRAIVSWPSGISARTAQTPSRSLERRRSPGS